MAFVFITYRKQDSGAGINDLRMKLKSLMPDDRIYLDVPGVYPSRRLQTKLDRQLKRANVMLTVIGPDWLTGGADDGRALLDAVDDPLRQKIATALELEIKILPVLVHGGHLPRAGDLPADLRALADLPYHEIRDDHLDQDVEDLERRLRDLIAAAEQSFEEETQRVDAIMEEILEADGEVELAPGLAWDDFYPIGEWHCDIEPAPQDPVFPPGVRVAFAFSVGGDGQFRGLWTHLAGDTDGRAPLEAFDVTGDWLLNVDHSKFERVIGLRLRGSAKNGEEFEWEIPLDEQSGESYQGRDELGRIYIMTRR
jgi:hypothetical protein